MFPGECCVVEEVGEVRTERFSVVSKVVLEAIHRWSQMPSHKTLGPRCQLTPLSGATQDSSQVMGLLKTSVTALLLSVVRITVPVGRRLKRRNDSTVVTFMAGTCLGAGDCRSISMLS